MLSIFEKKKHAQPKVVFSQLKPKSSDINVKAKDVFLSTFYSKIFSHNFFQITTLA